MPEGDSLYRIAETLRPRLVGTRVDALTLPRSTQDTEPVVGTSVTRVEARGKNLLIFFGSGHVLHTHLKMNGIWHLYSAGAKWRRRSSDAVVILRVSEVAESQRGWEAVCFLAPVVRLIREEALARDPRISAIGPDLLGDGFDVESALANIQALARVPLGLAIVDQRALAGIGNVYKSEVLFRRRLDPFARVSDISTEALRALIVDARDVLSANVSRVAGHQAGSSRRVRTTRTGLRDVPGGPLSVYERLGKPCYDCGTAIEMKRQGMQLRSTYYCPKCQNVTSRR